MKSLNRLTMTARQRRRHDGLEEGDDGAKDWDPVAGHRVDATDVDMDDEGEYKDIEEYIKFTTR